MKQWNMSETTKSFLEKNLPEIFQLESLSDVLELLYDFIDDRGFEPPKYEDYNDLGREAQRAYDDLYMNNE